MALLGPLVDVIVQVIGTLGYPGLFLMMAAESMFLPVPSEVVMPFAGYLVFLGSFAMPAVLAAAFAGSMAGSLLSYGLGARGGRPFVERYGRWLLVGPQELAWTERFFARYGPWAVLVVRFVPVVRHVISIPAGMARMRLAPFLLATGLGAFAWNAILAYAGVQLGPRWQALRAALEPYELAVLALVVLLVAAYVALKLRAPRADTGRA